MMASIFPYEMQIDTELLVLTPTFDDPLATEPKMQVAWTTDAETGKFVVSVRLFGMDSPWLEPKVLCTWLLVEYPELIRMNS